MRDRLDAIVNRLLAYRERYDRARDSRAVFTGRQVDLFLVPALAVCPLG